MISLRVSIIFPSLEHEVYMRKAHMYGPGDDSKSHLSSFYVAKGAEFNNPLAPDQGASGNMYLIVETYFAGI